MSKLNLQSPLILLLISTCLAPWSLAQEPNHTRYVLAPSGLNFRAGEDLSSQKLTKIEFGEAVEILDAAPGPSLTVDQIKAPMVPVQYGAQTGFIFAGYLSQFPPPEMKPKELNRTETYAQELQHKSFEVTYELHYYDHNGPTSEDYTFYLPNCEWEEAFLVAKTLYQLPGYVLFPKPSSARKQTFSSENSKGYSEIDRLDVKRDENGKLLSLTYSRSGEGYSAVTVEWDPEYNRMKITESMAAC